MTIRNKKDFLAGLLFIFIGAGAAAVSQENEMGQLSRMGPAYFPCILGVGLALLGAVLSIRALIVKPEGSEGDLETVHWGVLLCILGSTALFALTLLQLGLILAMAILITVSSFAYSRWRAKEIAVLIVVLCAACWAIFVLGLGMQIPVLPWFMK
jgi:hypothetical protein